MSDPYCAMCDATTAETQEGHDGAALCPRCFSSVYESREAYREEMIDWLADYADMPEEEVLDFLREHGNPGKGQAAAIVRRQS